MGTSLISAVELYFIYYFYSSSGTIGVCTSRLDSFRPVELIQAPRTNYSNWLGGIVLLRIKLFLTYPRY